MLCRRCGMESSTTDICEWCNRPMLPAGAAVSGKAAKDLKRGGQPVAAPPRPSVAPEVGVPLHQQPGTEPEIAAEEKPVASQAATDLVLRPLGHGSAAEAAPAPASAQAAPRSGGPSHGLADEAMDTSVDISQYMGKDQSIFRPIQKETGFSSASSLDRVTQKKVSRETGTGSNWSENERLIRCAIAGIIVGVVFALAGHFVSDSVPDKVIVVPVGAGGGVFAAVKFGIISGLMFGFMLGAALVRFQKGPFLGMIAGLLLGFSIQNGVWGYLAGAVSGIFVGRFATLGVRKVINV